MIIPSLRGKDIQQGKQEGETNTSSTKFCKGISSSSSSSRQWQSLNRNNPRIVRVSRSFGGKDRHSKVTTVRGLRDRRIRLSVPTAIQLYDLQDKLGVAQPSKVIDWLLEASKLDIDMLPPLQLPLGSSFEQFHHDQMMMPIRYHDQLNNVSQQPSLNNIPSFLDAHGKTHYSLLSSNYDQGCKVGGNGVNEEEDQTALIFPKSRHWTDPIAAAWSTKSKEIQGLERLQNHQAALEDFNYNGNNTAQLLYAHQNTVPMAFNDHNPVSNFSNNSVAAPYVPFYNSELSSLSLSSHQLRSHSTFPSQTDDHLNSSTAAFPKYFNSFAAAATHLSPFIPYHVEDDQRPQMSNHFQLFMNTSTAMNSAPNSNVSLPYHHQYAVSSPVLKPSPLMNVNSKLLHFASISDDETQAKIE